jgi:hypothetical protein
MTDSLEASAELVDLEAYPAVRERSLVADERTTVAVGTAAGGQVVRLAQLLGLNPPDGRSSRIEWQPEGHRRV